MSNKRKTANGLDAAADPILLNESDGDGLPAAKSSNGRTKANGKTAASGNGMHDGNELDSRELLRVLAEVRNGNFGVRMPIDQIGINGKICDTLNDIISLNEKLMIELTKAGNTIGKQGKLTHRVALPYAQGSWSNGVDSINGLISDIVQPTTEIAHVISSV